MISEPLQSPDECNVSSAGEKTCAEDAVEEEDRKSPRKSGTEFPPTDLPSPEDRPEADIVIFDSQCKICAKSTRKLLWWDAKGRLAYLSLHDSEVPRRFPGLSPENLMEQMLIVAHNGERYWGAEALRYLTRRLPRLWWLYPIAHFPGSMVLWRPLYKAIAKVRYLFGRTECDSGSCRLHG